MAAAPPLLVFDEPVSMLDPGVVATATTAIGAAAALSDKLNYLSIEGLNVYRFGYIPAEAFGDKALLVPIYVRYKDCVDGSFH